MRALVSVKQLRVEIVEQVVAHQRGGDLNRFGGPEGVDVERAEAQSFFEVFDDVLVVGARTVLAPDVDSGKVAVVGDQNAVTVLSEFFVFLEQQHLFAMLAWSLGAGLHVLAHHDVAPRMGPFGVGVLEEKLAHFESLFDGFPVLKLGDLPLDRRYDRHGQDITIAPVFKVFDELDEVKAAVA